MPSARDGAIRLVAYDSLSEFKERMRRADSEIIIGNHEGSRSYYLLEMPRQGGRSYRIGCVSRFDSPVFAPKAIAYPGRNLLVVMLDETVYSFEIGGSRPVKSREMSLGAPIYDYLKWDQVQLLVIFETGVAVLNMVTDTYAIISTDLVADYEVSGSGLRIREDSGRSTSILLSPPVPR